MTIPLAVPHDGHVSIVVKNVDGVVVRQLVNSEILAKGRHAIAWDGLTTPHWKTPGDPVPPGDYTWSAIIHKGIGVRLRGWAYHGTSDPWDVTPTSYWGADHAPPVACAADDKYVYLGWAGAEAGKALIGMDLDDKVMWGAGFHFNSADIVAVDDGIVYYVSGDSIKRVNREDGEPVPWPGRESGTLLIKDMWGDVRDPETDRRISMPSILSRKADGMVAHNGKLYISFSQWTLDRSDVSDWRGLLTKIRAGGAFGDRLWRTLDKRSKERIDAWLASDKSEEEGLGSPIYYIPDVRDTMVNALKATLFSAEFVERSEIMSRDKRIGANRRNLHTLFPDEIAPAESNFIAVMDLQTGKVVKKIEINVPGKMAIAHDRLLYVFSERNTLLALDPVTEKRRIVLHSLPNTGGLTADGEGRIYLAYGRPHFQIFVYSPEGALLHKIGKRGGRVRRGPWSPEGMGAVWGLALDARGQLWCAETELLPKRFSVWNPETGAFIKEFFGPTHYGASGGAINPRDPDLMVGESCEFRIDPDTGRDTLLGIFTLEYPHSFARFCEGPNGKLYLAVLWQRKWWQISIFERLGDADYKYCGVIRPDKKAKKTYFWSDENGDQRNQRSEIHTLDQYISLGGYNKWSMNMNTDLTVYGDHYGTGVQVRVKGFTGAGAPLYDLENVKTIPGVRGSLQPSRDNNLLVSSAEADPDIRCYDVASGKLRWTYPSTFTGVHGSHYAPGAARGLIRGAFGLVGSATLPAPVGRIWAINTNVGEWHLLTEDGYYLSRVFQPEESKQRWPEKAVPGAVMDNCPAGLGGEDFGGSLTQGTNGTVYVQAGKVALWNTELVGFDTVEALGSGTLTITEESYVETVKARESFSQTLAAPKTAIAKAGSPTFTGDLRKDFDGVELIPFNDSATPGAVAAVSWDAETLYVGWEVRDPTPWVNGADEPATMYAAGDTVDLQLGTDPKADPNRTKAQKGDFRLSIGNFNGTPTAVLYRRVASRRQKATPRSFSSGVVTDYRLAGVDVLADARIHLDVADESYTVEVAIPLASLGIKKLKGRVLRGDLGVTHSDANGQDTGLRTHWSNKATGAVDDEVFELMMSPGNWGTIEFRE